MSVHVTPRPFPGHVPAPAPDPSVAASAALSVARRSISGPTECPLSCRICHDAWKCYDKVVGHCVVCNEPARCIDPGGNARHMMCDPFDHQAETGQGPPA